MTTRWHRFAWMAAAMVAACCAPAIAPAARADGSGGRSAATWHAYQRSYQFQQLDGRNGLAQNSVSLIAQDHKGFMWFATQGGLFRYDGYRLTRYTHEPDRADSLPDDYRVQAMADAGAGRWWIGSARGGLTLFDPATNRAIVLPAAVQREGTPVTSLLNLPGGGVLVGSPRGVDLLTGGAAHASLAPVWMDANGAQAPVRAMTRCDDGATYAAAGEAVIALDPAHRQGRVLAAIGRPVNALFCNRKGALLIGGAAGLARVDRRNGAISSLLAQATRAGVVAITADRADRLWLALGDHSLLRLSPDGATLRLAPAPLGIVGGLPDSPIETLFVDRTGLLWIGTLTSGVVWTHPDGGPIDAVLDLNRDPRSRAFVRAFQPAAGGQFWIAMSGSGLVRYDPATREVTSYATALQRALATAAQPAPARRTGAATGAIDARISAMTSDAGGTLLLASTRGILRFDPATGTAGYLHVDGTADTAPARTLLRARNGDLWVAAYVGGGLVRYRAGRTLERFGTLRGLASNEVMALAEDRAGNIWAGTTNGLSLIDPATGTVRTFRETPGDEHSLAGRTIISLLVDTAGRLWVGSLSGISRLDRIDSHGAQFKRYTLGDGLPDDTINCMLEDAGGRIWFSTNLGVGRLNPATGTVRNFGSADGTQGDEYNSGACLRSGKTLLFGGSGFDIIDPARVRPSAQRAPIAFTDIQIGADPVPVPYAASSVLALDSNDHSVHAAFATLDYAASARNRFRYRLIGSSHAGWTAPTTRHTVTYTDLPSGPYHLEVQAVLSDGSLGNAASLRFDIPTVWWWRLPMRLVYAIALALLVLIAVLGWRGHHLEQARHRRQLLLRENRLRQALWGSGDEFWDWDLERGTILRLGPEDAPGGHHEEAIAADQWRATMVHPDDLANLDRAMAEHIAGHTEHFEAEHRVRDRDGEWIWVISRGRIVERDANGKPLRMCGTERDTSAIRAAERDRRIASEVIRSMSEAVAVTDLDYRFVSVNTAFTRITGYTDHEVLGRDASLLNGSRHVPASYSQLRQALAETGHWRGELWQRRKDGEEFLCWMELNEVCDTSGQRTHMISVLTDITDRKRAEQELRYLANYDTLTGLPNRTLLGERLGAAVIGARRSGEKVGLLFLDLDRFKHINDSLGHSTGDRTLKAAGARLRQCVRETDVVARLGGDEFTVVLENLANVRGAEDMARRLIHAFERPLPITATQETVISPSIGIALYPDHGQTPADLLKCADTAMYQA
ncbi:MAG: diguanylate cyclase domain-containing protein, partial [Rhodanobacteraceae bacterium]